MIKFGSIAFAKNYLSDLEKKIAKYVTDKRGSLIGPSRKGEEFGALNARANKREENERERGGFRCPATADTMAIENRK